MGDEILYVTKHVFIYVHGLFEKYKFFQQMVAQVRPRTAGMSQGLCQQNAGAHRVRCCTTQMKHFRQILRLS